MIFPKIEADSIVQVEDKLRINASRTFVSADEAEITLIEVEPEAASGYIDITTERYLDWAYATAGEKVTTLRVTTDGAPVSVSATLTVITEADDALFSNDVVLTAMEPDVYLFIPEGKNSFNFLHREVQTQILEWLDEKNIKDSSGDKLTKAALVDKEEFRRWSAYMVLERIFRDQSNAIDDVFSVRSNSYKRLVEVARGRNSISLDVTGDGEKNPGAGQFLRNITVFKA